MPILNKEKPAKPKTLSLWRYLKTNAANQPEKLYRLLKSNAPFLRFSLSSRYFVADPDVARHVLLTNRDNFTKESIDYRLLNKLIGPGLLTSIGKRWQGQRQVIQPLFRLQHMETYCHEMVAVVQDYCQHLDALAAQGVVIDIGKEMLALSVLVVCRSIFHIKFSIDEAKNLAEDFSIQHEYIMHTGGALAWVPSPSALRYNRAKRRSMRQVKAIIKQCLADKTENVLNCMQGKIDLATNKPYTDADIFAQATTFLAAGHETTGLGLTWAWYLLAKNPSTQQQLMKEADTVLQGQAPCYDQLEQLDYSHCVFQEAIRLYPPIWLIPRAAIDDDVVAGYKVAAGSKLMIINYAMHRLPQYWQSPDEFRPQRFSKAEREKRHKFAFLPFGAGPHVCVANLFSLQQAKIVLAMLAQRYDMQLLSQEDIPMKGLISLRPIKPIMMRLTKRQGDPRE